MDGLRIERLEVHYRKAWPRDLMRVRRSAFGPGDGPRPLRRQLCWYVRATVDRRFHEPKLVGYVVAYPLYDTTASFDEIAVHQMYQRHGVAGALTADIVDWLEHRGYSNIIGMAIHPAMATLFSRHGIGNDSRRLMRED